MKSITSDKVFNRILLLNKTYDNDVSNSEGRRMLSSFSSPRGEKRVEKYHKFLIHKTTSHRTEYIKKIYSLHTKRCQPVL